MENWKTWEITYFENGREYLEVFYCGTLEMAEEWANNKERETGVEYYVNFLSEEGKRILTW